ncbi:MAG: hypothetical protein KGH60_02130 [Candidatus Micrarchaeota archaeon]|nr:hypothetical protein [Candidatus Micrarchaeota archaeon]
MARKGSVELKAILRCSPGGGQESYYWLKEALLDCFDEETTGEISSAFLVRKANGNRLTNSFFIHATASVLRNRKDEFIDELNNFELMYVGLGEERANLGVSAVDIKEQKHAKRGRDR